MANRPPLHNGRNIVFVSLVVQALCPLWLNFPCSFGFIIRKP